MSVEDFDRCTPPEFSAIAGGWMEGEEHHYRTSWEQTRMLAVCILQPYSEKELRPEDVLKFSWEEAAAGKPQRTLSAEEKEAERKRYEEVKKARGLQ